MNMENEEYIDGTLWIRTRMEKTMKSACKLTRNIETTGMSYCVECRRVWERKTKTSEKIDYYTDFPPYGKPKKICPECLGMEK
jgi:hypothetical protein